MADRTPRHADSGFEDDPFESRLDPHLESYEARPLPPEELATRKWMLVIGGAALAMVVVVAVALFTLGGGDAPADAPLTISAVETSQATVQAGASVVATSTAAPAASATPSAAALAEARANIARLEGELRDAQARTDELTRQLEASAQVLRITTDRADSTQSALSAAQAERADFQSDYDAIDTELTQANADRAALRGQIAVAQARAEKSEANAAALAANIEAVRDCLDVHQQALYYTTLDSWGFVAAPMQDAAYNCFQQYG